MDFKTIKNSLNERKKLLNSFNKKKNLFYKKLKNELSSLNNKNEQLKQEILSKTFKFQNLIERAQDILEKKIDNRKEETLLKQSTYWAKSLTWTMIGGSALGVAWLSLAKTEEIIVVQGRLEPIKRVVDVQIPIGGVIEELLVEEGQIVSKGQTLLKLDQETSSSRLKSAENILDVNLTILEKLKTLMKEGAISEFQYLQQKIKVEELKNNVVEQKVVHKYTDVLSPLDGIVFDLKPSSKGFVAQTSEPVLKVVPKENLRARIEIDSTKIGFVKIDKAVDISIDSFPSSDFGVLKGKIESIGSDALAPNRQEGKGYRFPAIIKLEQQKLKIKDGSELPLQTGMGVTANIKLRKVSYLKLLLNTFSDKADSLRTL
tara:strand:+ start:1712 stop:2833 length:1122 start_codon:yes stop_codon:yes gene_type:complete